MLPFEGTVRDRESAVDFIEWCVQQLGLGFHPDTPFAEYINLSDGTPSFSDEHACAMDALLDKSFEYCDPYQVGMIAFQRILDPENVEERIEGAE